MNWFDFICLWTGYAVCGFALLRVLMESFLQTRRTFRIFKRWMTPMIDRIIVSSSVVETKTIDSK